MGGAIIAVICIIGSLIWGLRAGKKRKDEMTLLAEKLGMPFNHERDYRLADPYSFLDKFCRGSNQYACNRLSGIYQDHEISAFDFHYETYSTDSKGRNQTQHHYFSFFILTLPKSFPALTVAKESFLSKAAPAVELDEIDFESAEFSATFVVRAKDKKFAADFCNAHMIDYLLGHSDLNIEVEQDRLVLGFDSRLKSEEIESHLNQLVEIRAHMPDDLFED